ncbi:DUF1707 domain-containing protein [Actinomadura fulvescens]|uniref:DUF1707 domain-containing protein n=1 Tax=Actinomadura fulvescens TaxID=46160 RepID=A0ABP6C0Y9_9ACTN
MYGRFVTPEDDHATPRGHAGNSANTQHERGEHPMATPDFTKPAALRASDADRNAVIERLGDALADGALDTAEYHRRLEAAATAVTVDRLEPLTADLPVSRARAEAARQQADKREWLNEWGYWGAGALIMTVIWAVSSLKAGELTWYWPVAPLGIWAAVLVSYALWPDAKDKHRDIIRR